MYSDDYTTMNKSDISNLLEEIGLAEAESAVYIALLDGAQSVSEVIKQTGEKRPTVYYSLNSLEKRGLVSKTGKEYGNKFQINSLKQLETIVQNNVREQEVLLEKTKKLITFYPKNTKQSKSLVSYFESLESIKLAIFSSLYAKEKRVRSIVPAQNYFHEMGQEFVLEYVKEKQKRKLKTIALWEDIPNKSTLSNYYDGANIRQLPIDMHNSFDTTIFIFDNKTLYVSPKREQYAVLIQSEAHSKMMKAMFDNIWSNAISLK
jgi:HTH-type transcriptional regulator, sugar sensing transcriptional regulator